MTLAGRSGAGGATPIPEDDPAPPAREHRDLVRPPGDEIPAPAEAPLCSRGEERDAPSAPTLFGKISAATAEVQVTDSQPPDSGGEGTEPDPRYTFANERTFLAWSRTALALVVAGLGVVQLLPPSAA
jgi:hypothetical protein